MMAHLKDYRLKGSMGMTKHGRSGHAGKSPKLRMAEKLAAEREEDKKPKKNPTMTDSVQDLFHKGKRK